MPAATPPSIRSSTGRLSGCGLVLSCGSTVVVFMPPACCAAPCLDIGKIPDSTLMGSPPDQGSPGWRKARPWRDDGYVEERNGSGPPRLADGQDGRWRPGPDRDGAAPDEGWLRHRHAWRRWRHRQWIGRSRSSGPLRRAEEDRLVAGVAAGLAARTGIDVTIVRIAFV